MKPKLIILQGVAGSGKSTVALKLQQEYSAIILSSDILRKQIIDQVVGRKNDYWHSADMPEDYLADGSPVDNSWIEDETWRMFTKVFNFYTASKLDIILDATFLRRWSWEKFMLTAKGLGYEIIGVTLFIPLDKILVQNAQRSRNVPETVIHKMYESYSMFMDELDSAEIFDIIQIYKTSSMIDKTYKAEVYIH